jgi:hypothetical protein
MAFFEDIDNIDVLESHADALFKLEKQESTNILKIFRRVAQKLASRLTISQDKSAEEAVRFTLLQVNSGIDAIEASLRSDVEFSTEVVANLASKHLGIEMGVFERKFNQNMVPININAVKIASQSKNFLFNTFDASIKAYSQSLRDKIAMGLQDAIVEVVPPEDIIGRMVGFFGREEWRLRRIVRTEMHNIYGTAKQFGMEDVQSQYFPDLKKTLYHPMDSRTAEDSIYAHSLNLVADIGEPFRYQWKGKWRVFNTIDRPNDRSIVIPYRKSWN